MRLTKGDAGIPALQAQLAHLATQLGHGIHFALRRLDTIHGQVQQAIEPQAVALGVFGGLVALAMLALVGQGLAELLHRSAPQLEVLGALGMTRFETAVAGGIGGARRRPGRDGPRRGGRRGAVAAGPRRTGAPVRPGARGQLRQHRAPRRRPPADGGAAGPGRPGWPGGLSAPCWADSGAPRPSALAHAAVAAGLPTTAALGIRYALQPTPGRRRGSVRANLVGSIVAVTAVITAVVFGASLNGLVSHPVRYGWNWNVLIQSQGGYGDWYGFNMDKLMAAQPGVQGWSTFAFTQLPIDGQSVPVLGIATHGDPVEPPTVSGRPLDGPNEIELGDTSLRQLGKQVGDTVLVGTGATARHLKIVGAVTLPSIGVSLADHVSLGRGAMLPEQTLLSIENFFVGQ